MFQPKSPAIFATPEALDVAEAEIDMAALTERAITSLSIENYRYVQGKVERGQLQSRAIA
jgi:hypothetical protein